MNRLKRWWYKTRIHVLPAQWVPVDEGSTQTLNIQLVFSTDFLLHAEGALVDLMAEVAAEQAARIARDSVRKRVGLADRS